ncbi:MAG: hypothetical protein Q7J86_05265, partial [Bacteroidota bacterium]|nr:hypothetical protein [Bacteroidota bacterium]
TFFGKDTLINPEIYVNEGFNLDGNNPKLNNFDIRKVLVDPTGQQKFYQIEPESYSPSLQLNIDSLLKLPARITVDCWLKTDKYAHSNVAIETENASGEKTWNGININQQIVDQGEISHIFSYLDLNLPVKKVTVYIWNNGKKPVSLYSMTVKIIKNI